MFYTGLDPFTMQKIYVPKSAKEKQMQRALLQYFKPENREIVRSALILAKRQDLIKSLIGGANAGKKNDKKRRKK
jgi:hypothetical protein